MDLEFLGVGEAFDESLPNTSVLLHEPIKLLMDCGYSVPAQVWKRGASGDYLDAVYLSHPHADHYFGLPVVLARMWEDKRTKPLTIISQPGVIQAIRPLLDDAYRGVADLLAYRLEFLEAVPGKTLDYAGVTLEFAPTTHSAPNLAIKLSAAGKTLCYSGDGMYTTESSTLFQGCDLLIHETYTLDTPMTIHGNVRDVVTMAVERQVGRLALVHLKRTLRGDLTNVLDYAQPLAGHMEVTVPEPLTVIHV
jgi:ribonuclease BN (tRNA processing enzyme)